MTRFTIAILFAAVTFPLLGQQAPSVARGFDPDKVFAAGPIDSVNIFNGNVLTTIPLGETYVVSPSLSYTFRAIHNGKTWDSDTSPQFPVPTDCGVDCEGSGYQMEQELVAVPDLGANAGFGWRISFGGFISGADPRSNSEETLFEGLDGATHATYGSLHVGDPTDGPSFSYSRDGSYLRLRGTETGSSSLDTPDGLTYEFDATTAHNLTQIHDRVTDSSGNFLNRVDIQYGPKSGESGWPCDFPALSWKVTDTKNRTQFVCLANQNYDGKDRATVTDIYAAAATPSGQAHYALQQVQKTFNREGATNMSLWDPMPWTVTVPALTGITLPDGSSYGFEYYQTPEHPGNGTPGDGWDVASGTLYSTTLPTKGYYRYVYGLSQIPGPSFDCITREQWDHTHTATLATREEFDADGTSKGRTAYAVGPSYGGIADYNYTCTTEVEPEGGPWAAFEPGAAMTSTVIPPDNLSKTVHYYSVWPGYNRTIVDSPVDGFKRTEYGLPFTREVAKMRDGLFLSTETYACTDASHCDQIPFEATYVQYEVDAYEQNNFNEYNSLDHNPRLKASQTVYFGDGGKVSKVSNSDFDGLGHYRSAETSGFGSLFTRRTSVDFNPGAGSLPGTHSKPSPIEPWLLNLYTNRKVEEFRTDDPAQTVVSSTKTDVCYDMYPATGFLKRMRVYASGTTPSQSDVLAVFDNDGSGNVAAESYFGGDDPGLPSGFDTCNGSISGSKYRITHNYAFGALKSSQYDGATFKSYDADVNVTGSISASRDTALAQTTYEYDGLGRLTAVKPPGAAWTEYQYTLPSSGTDHPAVAVRQRPQGTSTSAATLTEQRFYFDGLGRLIERKSSMPGNEWATVTRTYDNMGRIQKESAPYTTNMAEYEVPAGATYTQRTYGNWIHPASSSSTVQRTDTVTLPDGTSSSITYTGASEQDKTSSVATGYDHPTDQTTKDSYDYLGRLVGVAEKNATITANYGYDIADHLSSVGMTGSEGTQSRSFHYDGRGFLTFETHPENGTTIYKKYDPRGHAEEKHTCGDVPGFNPATLTCTDSAFDLNMTFDSAERLIEVDSRNPDTSQSPWRPSKIFSFATANTSSNYSQGRLSSAIRHNYQPLLGDIVVSESFAYDIAGRMSSKTTAVSQHSGNTDSAINSFEQDFKYDALGNILQAGYPTCADPTKYCGSALGVFENTYDNGYLISVPGFVDSISYYPSGVVKQVNHANALHTVQAQDDSGMARIKSIKVENYSPCPTDVPVIEAQPAGATISGGLTATLSVSASGSSSLSYQWYDAATATPIAGATDSSYTTPALTRTAAYFVVVSAACRKLQSNTATISIASASNTCSTVTAPQTVSAAAGTPATLTAQTTGSAVHLTWYQGAKGDTSQPPIPACQDQSTCQVTEANGTQYWVMVPASPGCIESDSGTITVTWGSLCDLPPVIDSFVDANTAVTTSGSTHVLTVAPHCTDSSTQYGWTSQTLPATTDQSFTPESPSPGTARVHPTVTTTYYATVSEPDPATPGHVVTVKSGPVTVHVYSCDSVHITAQPTDQWVSFGATAHLAVDAGTGSFNYEWYQIPTVRHAPPPLSGDPSSVRLTDAPSLPSYDTHPIQIEGDDPLYFWVRVVNPNNCSVDSRVVAVYNCPRITTQPHDVTVTPAMNRAVVGVVVTGSGLRYQWYQGESGDTSNPVQYGQDPNLAINVNATTKLWLRITGPCGPVDSHSATVTMCYPPVVTTQPQPYQLATIGGAAPALTADSNLPDATYLWFEVQTADDLPRMGQQLDAGKTVTLTGLAPGVHLVKALVLTADSTLYTGCSTASNVAIIEVCAPPSIVSGVNNVTISAGHAANFIISVDQPEATVDWYLSDPAAIPTPPMYAQGLAFGPRPDHTTTYWLRADNGKCQSAATTVTVFVCTPKITGITVTPSSQPITEGTQVTLHVDAVGDATPVSAAWYTGTTAPTTLVGNGATVLVTPLADTTYWAEVSAPCPQVPYVVTSDPVTITVCHPPHITGSTPSAQVVAVNEYITLWTTTTGTNVQAHWYKGAVGDTSTPIVTLAFPATTADAGDYWVNVTGDCGNAVTATAHVDVCSPPVITLPPANIQIASGSTKTLSVTATGTSLTYSWMRINADETETQVGTSASYTTDPITVATQYYVIVTSQGHCAAAKANVTVSVCSPPQFTTAPPLVYVNTGPVNLSAPVDDPNATTTWYASDPRLGPATVVTSPVNPTAQTMYWAQAQDGICVSGVTSETVVICTPQFTSVTPSQTITQGNPVTLQATAAGPSIAYKWWTGTTSPTTQIAASNSITVSPTIDTNYWAEAQCSCPITTYPLRQEVTITVCHPASITAAPQPAQNVTVGDWVFINATTTGTNVQVHWYKGAVGDKSTPFTVSNGGFYATANDSGTYWVEAAGTCGTATASTVVDVCVPPVITTQPVGTQVPSGSSATLTVAASGSTLTYDWYIVNADNTQTHAGSGTSFNTGSLTADTKYVARVTSRGRCYTSSNQVTVSVCTVPQITYVAPSQTVGMQQPVTLYVAASGTSMQYEWKNLSTNQVIATTYSTDVAPSATTSYSVRVYSGVCSVTSATVTLTVCGPTITQQPASKTIAYGTSTTLTVAAVGDGTITAQWYRGGQLDTSSPAGTGLTLSVQPAVSTQYWVRVSTPCRSVDSAPALVTISGCTQPVITAQSGNTTIASDQSVTLSVTAQNTWDMHYQWYLWDPTASAWSAISWGTSSTYVENPTTVSNTYMVSLWNSCGLTTNSSSIAITRTPACYPAAITTQPHSVTFNAGSSVTFSVAASGTNIHYQWYASDPSNGTFTALAGQYAVTLTVTPQSQTAAYYVVATASCGASAVSSTVTATRNCTPPAASSQTQSQTIRKNTWVTPQFTATGTATISYTWYASTTGSNFTQVATGTAFAAQPQVTTYYYAVASNSCGSVTSSYITIAVTQCAPTISAQPVSKTINSTQSVTLTVAATSDQLHYQWYISTGGSYTAISGATAATLTYSPTATSYFYVNVFNDCGTVNSSVATVTVTPVCYAPTVSLTVPDMFGPDGTATITASFTGSNPTLTYYRTPPNGSNPVVVAGPGTSTQVQVPQGFGYTYYYFYVVASNACGTATSSWRAIGIYNPDAMFEVPGSSAVRWAGATSTEGVAPLRAPWDAKHPAVDPPPVAVAEEQPRTVALNQ
ncbi:MAG TPA: hypothetical protein VGJ81_18075 [Thermoanaerobaculia bacterium]